MSESQPHKADNKIKRVAMAAAISLLAVAAAIVLILYGKSGRLTLRNAQTGEIYATYPLREGDWFGVGFVHSVNKSPLTDYYQIKDRAIYVEKTVYYGFGAGVQTELEEGQTLTYGEDGSMVVSGFDQRMEDLTYFVGTVSDHTLYLGEGDAAEQISLRELCGRSARVRFTYEQFWLWQ